MGELGRCVDGREESPQVSPQAAAVANEPQPAERNVEAGRMPRCTWWNRARLKPLILAVLCFAVFLTTLLGGVKYRVMDEDGNYRDVYQSWFQYIAALTVFGMDDMEAAHCIQEIQCSPVNSEREARLTSGTVETYRRERMSVHRINWIRLQLAEFQLDQSPGDFLLPAGVGMNGLNLLAAAAICVISLLGAGYYGLKATHNTNRKEPVALLCAPLAILLVSWSLLSSTPLFAVCGTQIASLVLLAAAPVFSVVWDMLEKNTIPDKRFVKLAVVWASSLLVCLFLTGQTVSVISGGRDFGFQTTGTGQELMRIFSNGGYMDGNSAPTYMFILLGAGALTVCAVIILASLMADVQNRILNGASKTDKIQGRIVAPLILGLVLLLLYLIQGTILAFTVLQFQMLPTFVCYFACALLIGLIVFHRLFRIRQPQ